MVNICTGEMTKSEAYQLNRVYSSEQTKGGADFTGVRKKCVFNMTNALQKSN